MMAQSHFRRLPAGLAERLLSRHFIPKVVRQLKREPARFPHVTRGGRWITTADGGWTGGFWTGQLWLLWKRTGEPRFRTALEPYLARLAARKDAPEVDFDLGFLFTYSFALAHRLTGDEAYAHTALAAADRLLGLAHPKSGLIYHAYPERVAQFGPSAVSSIIDVMMNLSLLWWAYRITDDARYRDVAVRHALRSAEWLLRADGSLAQLVDFDTGSGTRLSLDTFQGASPGSCWSRGQAWAIYGFLRAAQVTGNERFMEAFQRALGYWADNIPADGVPPWDFHAPADSREVRDSSAAAIVLAALVHALASGLAPDGSEELAGRLLDGLLARLTPDEHDGVMGDGCFHFPRNEGVKAATVWGDYYLLEAVVGVGPSQ